MRVPLDEKTAIINFLQTRQQLQETVALPQEVLLPAAEPAKLHLPLFINRVPAGFPSPADDHIEGRIDLNELLIRNDP